VSAVSQGIRTFGSKDRKTFIRGLSIYNKRAKKVTRFKPRPYQEKIVDLVDQGHRRILVVKARQLGLSTIIRAIFYQNLYAATEPIRHAVVSHEVGSANEIFEMDMRFHENLPPPFRHNLDKAATRVTRISASGAQSQTFTANNSKALRSYAMESAHLSEGAFYPDLMDTLSIVDASVGSDGLIILESTANGYMDAFHKLVLGALAGENEWEPVFIGWWENELYTMKPPPGFKATKAELLYADLVEEKTGHRLTREQICWRRQKIRSLNNDIRRVKREFPSFVEECFQSTENAHYDPLALEEITPTRLARTKPGPCYEAIAEEPEDDGMYVVAVDSAQGVGRDYSVITVINCRTRQPVYYWWSNRWSPKRFSEQILRVCYEYGEYKLPILGIESNNHGHEVLGYVRDAKYPERFLWKYKKKDFITTKETRPLIYGALREMIDEGLILELEEAYLDEIKAIVSGPGERPDHPKGGRDDKVISLGLGYLMLKELRIPMGSREVARKRFEDKLMKARARRNSSALPWIAR